MLTPEQWEERKSQIGASDVPKLFNFNNKGAKDLWKEKVGLIEKEQFENIYTKTGNLIEEPCLMFAFKELDLKEYSLDDRVEHKEIKDFVVSLDGLDTKNNIPIENKTIKRSQYVKNKARFDEKGLEDTTYYRQLQAQISALNASGGYIVYNILDEEDYDHPLLYEPSNDKQEIRFHKRNKEMIKEIDSRVSYMLMCMKEVVLPSEKKYKEWLNERSR